MFQFALHSHATENATVDVFNWISRGSTRGTVQRSGTVERPVGRSVGRSISTISAPTGREGSDAVTENLKNRKRGKKTEKNGRNGHAAGRSEREGAEGREGGGTRGVEK